MTTFMSLSLAYCTVTFTCPNPFGTPSMGLKQPTTRCGGQFPVWQTGPEVHTKDVVWRTCVDIWSSLCCICCRNQVFHALVPRLHHVLDDYIECSTSQTDQYKQFLSTVTLLSLLLSMERSKIADTLISQAFKDSAAVVRQGEMGDTFFFVKEGEAEVTKTHQGDDGETHELMVSHISHRDCFGGLSSFFLIRLWPLPADHLDGSSPAPCAPMSTQKPVSKVSSSVSKPNDCVKVDVAFSRAMMVSLSELQRLARLLRVHTTQL